MDHKKYLGFVLVDGLTCAEENLMDDIGNKTNVFFVGGSAGDDLKFTATHVYANGKTYNDAAVLALIKVRNGFDIIKTQSFRVNGQGTCGNKGQRSDKGSRRVRQPACSCCLRKSFRSYCAGTSKAFHAQSFGDSWLMMNHLCVAPRQWLGTI